MTTASRGRRTWVATFVLVLLAGLLGGYFGPQISKAFRLRRRFMSASTAPRGMDSVPRLLADTSIATGKGTTLAYFGYRFEVPWEETVGERNPGEWVETDFKDGQRIKFVGPAYFESQPKTQVFPGRVVQSEYEQYKDVISMTPSQLSPFRSHREFERSLNLLNGKGALFEHNVVAPDIFSFETPAYRGFEISGLARGWNWVNLVLFDAADHRFELTFSMTRGSNVDLNQSEINRTIQTFAPLPSTSGH